MHEIGIMSSTLAAVAAEVRRQGATRVERILLRVGALSGADPAALQFAFAAVSPGTAAAGAVLEIELLPARAVCPDCAVEFEAGPGFITACPRCRRFCGELRQGRELELTRIEMT